MKLFDLGLAREFTHTHEKKHYTAMVGSPRYMAPEVANRQVYNAGCDVYSFSLLLWEILSLQSPFQELSPESMRSVVWNSKTTSRMSPPLRPRLHKTTWPMTLQNLMTLGWSGNTCDRPTMNIVSLILGSVYATMMHQIDESKDDEDLFSLPNTPSLSFSINQRHVLQLESMLRLQ